MTRLLAARFTTNLRNKLQRRGTSSKKAHSIGTKAFLLNTVVLIDDRRPPIAEGSEPASPAKENYEEGIEDGADEERETRNHLQEDGGHLSILCRRLH